MKSMTGFGRGACQAFDRRFGVELRSVNHRFLELKFRTPFADPAFEGRATQEVRRHLERGAVSLTVRDEGAAPGSAEAIGLRRVRADVGLAQDYFHALDELRRELHLGEPITLELLASQEGVLVSGDVGVDGEALFSALQPALDAALEALVAMRRLEGKALAEDMTARLAEIGRVCREIAERAAQLPDLVRRRIEERLARALPAAAPVDPGRLAQEVAIIADRADVTEELTRLASHRAQVETLLMADEPVGRKLDFLLQEMNREINTIGSKAQDAGVAARVVTVKAELEKLREQVQNIE